MRYKKTVVIITFIFFISSIIVIIPSFFLENEVVKNILLSVGFAIFGGSFVSFFVAIMDYLESRKDIIAKTFYDYLYIDNHFQAFIYSKGIIDDEVIVNILSMLEDELIKIDDKIKELYDSCFPLISKYLKNKYENIGLFMENILREVYSSSIIIKDNHDAKTPNYLVERLKKAIYSEQVVKYYEDIFKKLKLNFNYFIINEDLSVARLVREIKRELNNDGVEND